MTDPECELRWGEVSACQFEAGVNHASGFSLNFPATQIIFYWPSWPSNDLSKDQPQQKKCGRQRRPWLHKRDLMHSAIHAGRHKERGGYRSVLRSRHAIAHQNSISGHHIAQKYSEHPNRSGMSPYLMCGSLFWTAVTLMKVHIGDIMRPSTARESDLPLLGAALLRSRRSCEAGE